MGTQSPGGSPTGNGPTGPTGSRRAGVWTDLANNASGNAADGPRLATKVRTVGARALHASTHASVKASEDIGGNIEEVQRGGHQRG